MAALKVSLFIAARNYAVAILASTLRARLFASLAVWKRQMILKTT